LSDSDMVKLLQDIRKILGLICLSTISNLKKECLTTEVDKRIYDLCTRKGIDEIAGDVPELGYNAVYNRLTEWENRGLLTSEREVSTRGRPKKLFIKVEELL